MSSARKTRRELQRAQEKLAIARRQLAALQAGGTEANPRIVGTAALIELSATGEPCLTCGGGVALKEHRAQVIGPHVIRIVDVVCKLCAAPRRIWLTVLPPLAN